MVSEARYIYKTNEGLRSWQCMVYLESRFVLTIMMLASKLQLAVCSVIIYSGQVGDKIKEDDFMSGWNIMRVSLAFTVLIHYMHGIYFLQLIPWFEEFKSILGFIMWDSLSFFFMLLYSVVALSLAFYSIGQQQTYNEVD